ncbi:MAG: TylF/MycF/NovP-related O-methyltransferase [Magnetovibrionaceae bacterium]
MKFEATDKKYLAERKELSAKYGERELWSVIDHWPLYVGIANLGRFMAIADLFKEVSTVPGHVAEFGSWRGANLMYMAKLLKLYDPHGEKLVHCFESFEGLSTFVAQDETSNSTEGAYKGSYEELIDLIRLYDLQDDIVIHKGLIQDTLVPLLDSQKAMTFSFVYCDTDLYEPTKLILDSLHDRLAQGGLFVFDQWNDERWPGEGLAANEFLKEHKGEYEMLHIPAARQPTLAIRKITF